MRRAHILVMLMLSLSALAPTCVLPAICTSALCVTDAELVETRRITRTTFEFVYDMTVMNRSDIGASNVTAETETADPATQIVSEPIDFGTVLPGETSTRGAAFVIRQDRNEPIDPMSLVWKVTGRTSTGMGLVWDPALAETAVLDTNTGNPITPDEISTNALGFESPRTKVEIAFAETATFAEIQSLLLSENAQVTSALDGVGIVVVRVPDPGDAEQFEALRNRLLASPAVRYVQRLDFLEPRILPPGLDLLDLVSEAIQVVAHRGPATWNARALMTAPPSFVVPDFYGEGPPNSDVAANTLQVSDFSTNGITPAGAGHGYSVLGPLLGAFEGGSGDPSRGTVKGVLPVPTPELRVVDLEDQANLLLDNATFQNLVLGMARDIPGNVVLSISLGGIGLGPSCIPACPNDVAMAGMLLAEKVRALGLEDRVLIAHAAGNEGEFTPEVDSFASAATAAPAIGFGTPLTNMLVVEAVVAFPNPPNQIRCLADFSNYGGNIAFAGTEIWTFTGANSGASFLDGTSFAAPGAASAAAMIWSVRPELTAPQVVRLLLSTANPGVFRFGDPCSSETSAPSIDAYRALLATDILDGTSGSAANAPVRQVLLDVDEDGDFDAEDVEVFVAMIVASGMATPTSVDYSRFDLNGDGYTQPAGTTKFDLDATTETHLEEPVFETLTVEFSNGETKEFDENSMSDLRVLCYYTQTDLFSGSDSEIEDIDGFNCVPPGPSDPDPVCPAGLINNPCVPFPECCAFGSLGCDCF